MKWTDRPMFDLSPSVIEVRAAKAAFKKRLNSFAEDIACGTMRPEAAVSCALAEVWRQGRRYQRDQDKKALWGLSGSGKGTAV